MNKPIKKILVVDDEELDRDLITLVLKKGGYNEILCVDTGKKAIEMARSFKPDIAVIDFVLPDMDGFDVCKQIKAIEEIKTKIIIITGHLDKIFVGKARVSGADEIIEKTPGFEDIVSTLERIV